MVWAAVVATAVVMVASALMPGPMKYLPGVGNPLGLERAGWVLGLVEMVRLGDRRSGCLRLLGR